MHLAYRGLSSYFNNANRRSHKSECRASARADVPCIQSNADAMLTCSHPADLTVLRSLLVLRTTRELHHDGAVLEASVRDTHI